MASLMEATLGPILMINNNVVPESLIFYLQANRLNEHGTKRKIWLQLFKVPISDCFPMHLYVRDNSELGAPDCLSLRKKVEPNWCLWGAVLAPLFFWVISPKTPITQLQLTCGGLGCWITSDQDCWGKCNANLIWKHCTGFFVISYSAAFCMFYLTIPTCIVIYVRQSFRKKT